MSGGIARRPKRAKPVAEPEPEMVEDEPEMAEAEPEAEPEMAEDEPEDDVAMPVDPRTPEEEYPDDPEDHFVADDDAMPGATRDGKSETGG